ncbi:MAG: hypothetical protein GY953_58270, partial [bacterium]|nr:hypothetical protein [bacterium]
MEVHIHPLTRHRSADTYVRNWLHGRDAAMDWVVTHIIQRCAPANADENWAVRNAEAHKESYAVERCRARGIDFIPLAIDTVGGFGVSALKAIERAVLEGRFGWDHDSFLTEANYKMRLSVAALRGV